MVYNKNMALKPVADVISIEEIYGMGNSMDSLQHKALFFTCYLSGGRITEVLKMTKRDINLTDDGLVIFTLLTLKHKKHPIRKNPVLYDNNPKHETFHRYEKAMCDIILDYIEDKEPHERIFLFTRQRAYRIFTLRCSTNVRHTHGKNIYEGWSKDINPHYLRHCRLTHLRQEYGFDILALMQFAGWMSAVMAQTYLHVGYRDITREMMK